MDKFTNGLKALLGDKKLLITVIVHFALSFLFFLVMFFPFFRLNGGTLSQSFSIGDYTASWLFILIWIVAMLGYPVLIILDMKKIAWFVLLGQAAFAALIFILGLFSFFAAYAIYAVFHLAFGFYIEPILIALMALAGLLENTVMGIVFKTLNMK
ncbi:MAG: hypothetical protein NTV44_00890 [Firmicutes bacterium]|nr:hypothetical protein [Bacillota bacterium]